MGQGSLKTGWKRVMGPALKISAEKASPRRQCQGGDAVCGVVRGQTHS
ncbi:hypothetical protein X907_1313 [Glycocaulis alkaliphilus]|uniref:Uncharacterized protein n=1 Tax=Glycocaulis alkaliphilus TaxID=1434191 RepID=A0A3T0E9I0_9PROT|nr:hypothetical protein X907_1313 [Glycocaulis alkaliphilus]